MKYLSVVFKQVEPGKWRYVIESYPDKQPLSRPYASPNAVHNHVERLLAKGWQWAIRHEEAQA